MAESTSPPQASELDPAAPSTSSGGQIGGAALRDPTEITRLGDLTATQWKSGAAAWLGWFFDGLDMSLFTLVATPFVAQLVTPPRGDEPYSHADMTAYVTYCSSWIQAAFLFGWALGGSFFGRLGDRIGRSRATPDRDQPRRIQDVLGCRSQRPQP